MYWIEWFDLILKSTESQLIEIYKGIKSKILLGQCCIKHDTTFEIHTCENYKPFAGSSINK